MTHALLVAAAIALTILAHPPLGLWPLAFGMLAPLVVALEGASPRRGFALGWLYAVTMGTVLVRWLVIALADHYGVARPAAWAFTLGAVGALATLPGAATALYCALRPRVGATAAPILFAAAWTLGEWVRGGLLGFPWLLFGLSLHRVPLAIQVADLGGVWAVTFLVAAVNAGLSLAVRARRPSPLLPALVVAGLAALYGAWRLQAFPVEADEVGLRVGVVQAALGPEERFKPGSAARNTAHHAALTRRLAASEGRLDLVVWAETAVDGDLDREVGLRAGLRALATDLDTPLVTGAPRSAGGLTNSVVLFAPQVGLVESYAKQRLLPFSEYDPPGARLFEPLVGPLMVGSPYQPGREATIFRRGPLPLAAPICFEITYPGLVRTFRREGARLLLNLSNDAWFGRTGYPEIHFAHAVFRAVELRTWLVRAANTGISAVVDPAGRVRAELPTFENGTLATRVHPAGPPPLYARFGDPPVLGILAGMLAATVLRRAPS